VGKDAVVCADLGEVSSNSCPTVCFCVQLLKNLEPYIQQGLQVVQQLKAEEIQNEEGLEAQIYNYK